MNAKYTQILILFLTDAKISKINFRPTLLKTNGLTKYKL